MTSWDYLFKSLTSFWADLFGFAVVIGGFYVLWVLFSAIVKWGEK